MSALALFLQDLFCVSNVAEIQDLPELFDVASARLVYKALLSHPRLLKVLYVAHVFRAVFGYPPSPAIVEAVLQLPMVPLSIKAFIAKHTIFSCLGSAERITALQDQLEWHDGFVRACANSDFVLEQAWLWVKRDGNLHLDNQKPEGESTSLFKFYAQNVLPRRFTQPDDGARHEFTRHFVTRLSDIFGAVQPSCWYAADALHQHLLLNKHFFISIMTRKSVIVDPGVDYNVAAKLLSALFVVSKCKWNVFVPQDLYSKLKCFRQQRQFLYALPAAANVPHLFPKSFMGEHIIIAKNAKAMEAYSHIHNTTDKHAAIYCDPDSKTNIDMHRNANTWHCIMQKDQFKEMLCACTNVSQCPFVIPMYDNINPLVHQTLLDLYTRPLHTVPPAQVYVYLAATCSISDINGNERIIDNNNENAIVVVDNRANPMTAFAALVTKNNIQDSSIWDVVVLTSSSAVKYYESHLPGAKVVPLEALDDAQFDVATYNEYLKTSDFWSCLSTRGYKKVLMVQDDGFVVRPGVEKFLTFDYVGAPWATCPANQELSVLTKNNMVGNGGCSVRSVLAMLRITRDHPKDNEPLFNNNVQPVQEDVYFATHCENVADKESASAFASEQILSRQSIAFHKIWAYHSPADVMEFAKSLILTGR